MIQRSSNFPVLSFTVKMSIPQLILPLSLPKFHWETFALASMAKKVHEVVVNPVLCNPDLLIVMNASSNALKWGSHMEEFAQLGQMQFEDPLDCECPEWIQLKWEWEIDFDIEQNFVLQLIMVFFQFS